MIWSYKVVYEKDYQSLYCDYNKYKIGKTYHCDNFPDDGFVSYIKLEDCGEDYTDSNLTILEVEVDDKEGSIVKEGMSKIISDNIKIIRELSKFEINRTINFGIENKGIKNIGKKNKGSYNNGSFNDGSFNNGFLNKGYDNNGSCNYGNNNHGNFNRGYSNNGNFNYGNSNNGSYNVGTNNYGNYNIGLNNFGSYNIGCYNIGWFNTGNNDPSNKEFKIFDEPADIKSIKPDDWPIFLNRKVSCVRRSDTNNSDNINEMVFYVDNEDNEDNEINFIYVKTLKVKDVFRDSME